MIEGIDLLAVVVRAACFIALLQAVGLTIFVALYRNDLRDSLQSIEKLIKGFALSSILLVVMSQGFTAARMAGEISGMFDVNLESLSWLASNGTASMVRIVAAVTLMYASSRSSPLVVWIGCGLALISFALTGHTTQHPLHLLLGLVLVGHLAIVAYWFGALPGLFIAVRHETSAAAVTRFSLHATLLVPCIAVLGILLAIALLPSFASLNSPYGYSLIVKFDLFLLLMLIAAVNKYRLAPRVERGDGSAITALKRSMVCEYVLIVSVLLATATMTTLFSPE
jgi:putative copper export protein